MYGVTAVVLVVGVVVWAYQSVIRPPPPKICGSPGAPPVTSPRIKLGDGRFLAYRETGVAKERAVCKIILVHGFDSSKDIYLPLSHEVIEELGLYIVTFDRAGYGESDPNPKRSVKSEVFDIEQLADQLQLGPKFHLVGVSMGNYAVWGSLKYIPHRLAGASLIVPVINYWWPSFPPKLSGEVFKTQLKRDQLKLAIAHHAPGLLYWWMTQKWFPSSSIMERSPAIFSSRDVETIKTMSRAPARDEDKIRQQGVDESLHRDLKVGFGNWEFDPMDMDNPFPENGASVHLWQGYEDRLVPFRLQRYVVEKLPWIRYHEVADGGHLLVHEKSLCEDIFRTLVLQ